MSSNYWTRELTRQAIGSNTQGVQYSSSNGQFNAQVRAEPSMYFEPVSGQPGVTRVANFPSFVFFYKNATDNEILYDGTQEQVADFSFDLISKQPENTFTVQNLEKIVINQDGKYHVFCVMSGFATTLFADGRQFVFGFRPEGDDYISQVLGSSPPMVIEADFDVIASPRTYEFTYSSATGERVQMEALALNTGQAEGFRVWGGYISKISDA